MVHATDDSSEKSIDLAHLPLKKQKFLQRIFIKRISLYFKIKICKEKLK